MSSDFWAAIVGALLGGSIAAAVQVLTIWFSARERRRGLAYGLLFKISQIYSHLRVLNRHVEECLNGASEDDQASPWRVVEGVANMPSPVLFSPEEVALVLELNPGNIIDKLLTLDELHNATICAFQFYSDRRTELMEALVPARVDGQNVVTADVPLPLRAKINALNQFMGGIREHLGDDVGKALDVLQQLADLFSRSLKVDFPALPKPESTQPNANASGKGNGAPAPTPASADAR